MVIFIHEIAESSAPPKASFFSPQSFFYQMVTIMRVWACHFDFFFPLLYICDNEIHAIKYFSFSVVGIIYHKTHEFGSLFLDNDRWICFGLNITEDKEELSNYVSPKISMLSTPQFIIKISLFSKKNLLQIEHKYRGESSVFHKCLYNFFCDC